MLAKSLKMPIRYFTIATRSDEIKEVSLSDLSFEDELNLSAEQINEFIALVS